MKKYSLLKLILIIVFLMGAVVAGYYFIFLPKSNSSKSVSISPDNLFGWRYPVAKFPSTGSSGHLAYSDIRDPGGIPQGLPVRLKIPVIGVDSAIEDALIKSDGKMDVPEGSVNVAWFALGPHPGQVGSAVIGGHFGINNGVPYVFYNLDKLKIGDKVYVIDDEDNTIVFAVRSISLFDRTDDATTVFTSQDNLAHLNLITCEGIWNRVNDTYPERRVIFTDLISAKNAKTDSLVTYPRSLSMGARGVDVIALQTALEKKGFLTMPLGVDKGFFGSLTYAAVLNYQTSVGLPSVGIFGPLTRSIILSDLGSGALPEAGIASPTPPSILNEKNIISDSFDVLFMLFQEFIQFVWSLYSSLVDGLITSILIILIFYVSYKIVRNY